MLSDLDEWLTEEEAAAAVGKTVRRTVRYRKPAFVEHYRQREINPAAPQKRRSKLHAEAE